MRFSKRILEMDTSAVREVLALTAKPDIISFAGGLPAPESFPVEAMRMASDQVYRTNGRTALQYGPSSGYLPLREKLAQRTPFGMAQSTAPCSRCRGTGKIIHQPCKSCRGTGNIRRQQKEVVKIPAGIDDGQAVSIRGRGHAGANGGPAGDLLVSVVIRPHPRFERDGNSVLLEQNISYAQATLGAELEVLTLDGKVKMNIPEGTPSGTVFRIRGKGIPYLRGSGRGDQFVTVNVEIPKNLTSSQKELLRQFAASMGELDGVKAGNSGIFGKKKK